MSVTHPDPVCIGCHRTPEDIEDYGQLAREAGITPSAYVRHEEGTYNPANGHFACDACYISMGMPARSDGRRWVAP